MARDKKRIPQVGETVYLRGDIRCKPMYLDRVYTRDNVVYGYCHWSTYDMEDDELVTKENEKEFLLEELTVYADGK